jgi:catechol 2,3-dioxygenase-like lactoylglutathione lyase family enzyme
MPLTELNHYFVRANDLERSKRFYCEVLGFEAMPRPNFAFPGYWLGVGGKVQIHMGPHGIPDAGVHYMGTTAGSATDNAGVIDHIAFSATEPQVLDARLKAMHVPARRRYRPEIRLFQIFVKDPDGLTIEINFHGIELDPSLAAESERPAAGAAPTAKPH